MNKFSILISLFLFSFEVYICSMLHSFIQNYFKKENITSIQDLAQAGSDRQYARVSLNNHETFIACLNSLVAENESFFYFTNIFLNKNIHVPKIIHIDESRKMYLLEDLGNENLLNFTLKAKEEETIEKMYQKSLFGLVNMQIDAGKEIDYQNCFSSKIFDKQAVTADLNYFKYYFLDVHSIEYNKAELNAEFDLFANEIATIPNHFFMFRDFQGRNIMLKNNEPYFIDYQGGMQGPLQYDVASLLWQAKANLSFEMKEKLFAYYIQILKNKIHINDSQFTLHYQQIVLLRLLQVLGAYGLRGIIEKRQHFLSSIPFALQNIETWQKNYIHALENFPTLKHVLLQLSTENIKNTYKQNEMKNDTLTILVQSFSYKIGIPPDESGNGGGFMFDCRGILNPGRFDEYKKSTGRDQSVIEFLETKTKVHQFLQGVKEVIHISIEDYMARGFAHLQISFGCTGGQHRSVYCTDYIAKYIQEKYGVKVVVKHLIQDEKNWIN